MGDTERDEPSLELEIPRLRRPRRKRKGRPADATPSSGEQATVSAVPAAPTVADAPPPAAEPAPVATSGEQTTVLEVAEVVSTPPPAPRTRRTRPSVQLPSGWPAVVVTGLVVGLVVVGLTWLSLRTCEAVQGTTSCGTAGYPMLGLVLVLAVLAGGTLLRLAQVPDPVSTSLLAVGCAAVIALVFLIDHLDQPAMVVVIPLVCVATFAGAHWLTTAVIEPQKD
jgi:hypothetical protein